MEMHSGQVWSGLGLVGGSSGVTPEGLRRREPRAQYLTQARVRYGSRSIDGRTENISERGLQLLLRGELEVGAHVLVRFSLPTSGAVASVAAVVRWAEARPSGTAVGLELVEPEAEVRDAVRAFLAIMDENARRPSERERAFAQAQAHPRYSNR